ncbi:MAG: hypothetical protein CSA95_03775 [Bacteroidetes bacterium]|nr:MAG: hypothetical protein CSA95_03775 [Bacteroidota bacterium]PIE88008.1 MAG: hypothetical protein CSA04_04085 [Bacteroidota bacterium]
MEQRKNIQELEALIALLDDPEISIYREVSKRLKSYGSDILPYLKEARTHSFNPLVDSRLHEIIHYLQQQNLYTELRNWYLTEEQDLLKGFILISKSRYPELDEDQLTRQVERITKDVWLELNKELTALAKIRILNHIIFRVHEFQGDTTQPNAPSNYYLNNVLESRKGNPLSLSILYLTVARRLGIPLYGINLPKHFVLGYASEEKRGREVIINEKKMRFYVNPFRQGQIFSSADISNFLKQMQIKEREHHFLPCEEITIIRRLTINLINTYKGMGNTSREEELRSLYKALS